MLRQWLSPESDTALLPFASKPNRPGGRNASSSSSALPPPFPTGTKEAAAGTSITTADPSAVVQVRNFEGLP